MGAPALDTDVIIVGGGPCGLMLANELGRRRVRVVLLERKPGTARDPQANATQARTMEHYRRLGFAEEVRAAGLPADYPTDIAYFTRYARHELARFRLPSAGRARQMVRSLAGSWSAAELPHRVSQMFVERVLHRHAARLDGVDLRHGRLVDAVADRGDHVVAEAARGAARETVRGRFLIGCDGSRSLVRRALGTRLAGESGVVRDFMGGQMHAVYLRAPHLYELMSGERAWMYWAVNRERRSFMAAVDGVESFVFHTQLAADEARAPVSEDAARRMFAQALGHETGFEIISRSSWTAGYTLVAERLRAGRLLIAGDAAHLFTPTGGLGYNTAIEDAANLGWKLAALVHGWGGAGLLASYEQERRPSARRNARYARGFADSIGHFVPARELESDGPHGRAARAAAGAYLDRHCRAEFDIPGITFGTRYDGSPIIVADGTTAPPDRPNDYLATACPGGRAPHLWLEDGASLYDRLGFELTLLRLSAAAETGAMAAAARARRVPLAVVALDDARARDLYGADLALIRPDQVVAWRGDRAPDDAGAVLDVVTGRAPSPVAR